MFLLRLLILALVIWLAVVYLRRRRRKELERPKTSRSKRLSGERMVRCAHCQLHVPADEAVASDGRYYCSEAHRRAEEGE